MRLVSGILIPGMAPAPDGETEKQFRSLAEMGFELYRGYYFARPMPAEEFEQYLSAPGN